MSDVVIFTVGLGVMTVALTSAFIALIASDHPDEPLRRVDPEPIGYELGVHRDRLPELSATTSTSVT